MVCSFKLPYKLRQTVYIMCIYVHSPVWVVMTELAVWTEVGRLGASASNRGTS